MTIDERLDKLAQRHEALTQSLELLTHDVRDMQGSMGELREVVRQLAVSTASTKEDMRSLAGSIKSTTIDVRDLIRELAGEVRNTNGNLKKTKDFVDEIAEGTARLLHVAQVHERRISKLEGQEG